MTDRIDILNIKESTAVPAIECVAGATLRDKLFFTPFREIICYE